MIDIVIVNWNSGSQLSECVNSVLEHHGGIVSSLTIVDNGSTDSSLERIDKLSRVTTIRMGKNLGFAAACNIGATSRDAEYILFLNPDTRIEQNSLAITLGFMERKENSKVAVCGIQLIDEQDAISLACARFPTLLRLTTSILGFNRLPVFKHFSVPMLDWDHSSDRKVDHVIGAYYFVRRNVFDMVGQFDERFFVYLEDIDLSKRISHAGWHIQYIVSARAFHAGGGTSRQVQAKRLFYSLRSRLLYGFKHFTFWQAWVLVALTTLFEPITRLSWCFIRGDRAGMRHTISAYRMLWCNLKLIVRGEGRFDP